MGLLDRLYKSNPKDIASGSSQLVRRFNKFNAGTSAANTFVAFTDGEVLGADVVREIQFVSIALTAGAAQFPLCAYLQLEEVGAVASFINRVHCRAAGISAATTIEISVGWEGRLYQFPGERCVIAGLFNAGAALNNVYAQWGGIEFPRGSFQR